LKKPHYLCLAFFDPTPEQQNIVLIDAATLQKAQRMIAGCETCSEDAEIPFDTFSIA
jgi:hypothetical protein